MDFVGFRLGDCLGKGLMVLVLGLVSGIVLGRCCWFWVGGLFGAWLWGLCWECFDGSGFGIDFGDCFGEVLLVLGWGMV